MGPVDVDRVHVLRELLASTGWVERTRGFARNLRRTDAGAGGLMLVGTPSHEPWHLAAHLDDEARYSGLPGLTPTLVRWSPPPDAPPHLSVGLARLEQARRGETLFVVGEETAPEGLLQRVSDARHVGATILSLDSGDEELGQLAHDRLVVPGVGEGVLLGSGAAPPVGMDTVQHLVSVAAGESNARPSMRDRLARLLDHISGPVPRR
jgi:hypothetical protein